ncbi:MAG: FecR domain-containing protein [Puia sp.]
MKLGMKEVERSSGSGIRWLFMVAAAGIIGMIFFAIYRYQKPVLSSPPVIAETHDLPPGGKHAILTLNNGRIILLDTLNSGSISRKEDLEISKDSSFLNYETQGNKNSVISYDELKHRQWGIPGSPERWNKSMLNASSSLKYPEIFNDSVRRVELDGEAYFEVAKDAKHPFIVMAGKNSVRVLGTHFDVNNYPDNNQTIVSLLRVR